MIHWPFRELSLRCGHTLGRLKWHKIVYILLLLIALVKISKLTTRNAIADALQTFVEDAEATSRSLQKLNAKVNGAVDQ